METDTGSRAVSDGLESACGVGFGALWWPWVWLATSSVSPKFGLLPLSNTASHACKRRTKHSDEDRGTVCDELRSCCCCEMQDSPETILCWPIVRQTYRGRASSSRWQTGKIVIAKRYTHEDFGWDRLRKNIGVAIVGTSSTYPGSDVSPHSLFAQAGIKAFVDEGGFGLPTTEARAEISVWKVRCSKCHRLV